MGENKGGAIPLYIQVINQEREVKNGMGSNW